MFNNVKLGIAPIGWTNDDMPQLGGELTFEQMVSEAALAGFQGTEVGGKFPTDPAVLNKALDLRGIKIASQWIGVLQEDALTFIRSSKENAEHNPIVYRACNMIEEMFSDDISIQQIAAELELSPGYLSALLKKHTGKNFTEYVTGVRIEHAKQLLKQTNEKIYSIAVQTGFSDQYYFSRIFKRITGITVFGKMKVSQKVSKKLAPQMAKK